MITFENMEEYTEWFVKTGMELTRNQFVVVKIKSIDKKICVCSTPELIEAMAEGAAYSFMERWNEEVGNAPDVKLDPDVDLDLVASIRDKVLEALQTEMDMEIVFVSTEY